MAKFGLSGWVVAKEGTFHYLGQNIWSLQEAHPEAPMSNAWRPGVALYLYYETCNRILLG